MKFRALCLYAEPNPVDIIEHYSVNGARVYITTDARYLVVEPELNSDAHEIYSKMMEVLFYSLKPLRAYPKIVSRH
jgi:flagellar protein FlaI